MDCALLICNFALGRLLSAMPLLQRRLEKVENCGNISIVFPDDGAYKRFNSFFPTRPTIVCNKIRDGDKRIVTIRDGNELLHKQGYRGTPSQLAQYSCTRLCNLEELAAIARL